MTIAFYIILLLLVLFVIAGIIAWIVFYYKLNLKNPNNRYKLGNLQGISHEKIVEEKLDFLQGQLMNQKEELSKIIKDQAQVINSFKDQAHNQDKEFVAQLTTLDANLKNLDQNLQKQDSDLKVNLGTQNNKLENKMSEVIKDITTLKQSSETLNSLDEKVKSLQNVFLNSKKRGNLGEYLLETILSDMYGNTPIWKSQHKLPSGNIVDAYLNFSNNREGVAIDAKFPLSNYNKHFESSDKLIQNKFLQEFKKDVKNRVDEVAKFINKNDNIFSAIMFIPSEDIFSFIFGEFPDEVISYALKKNVWLTSPTTLSAILFVIDKHTKELEFNQNIELIRKNLVTIKKDFDRWIERWDDFRLAVNKIPAKVDQLDITHNKIKKQYHNIMIDKDLTNDKIIDNQLTIEKNIKNKEQAETVILPDQH